MTTLDSAKKILEVFFSGHQIVCLRDLAQECGFKSASARDFKEGFNFLVDKKVIRLQQSGWSSERGGSNDHQKSAMLVGDIFQVGADGQNYSFGFSLDMDKFTGLPTDIKSELQLPLFQEELTESRKELYRACPECKTQPVVMITSEQIGVCEKHWVKLADSDIEW